MRQRPAAGSEVEEGATVDLVLAVETEKKASNTKSRTSDDNADNKAPSKDAAGGKTNR